MKDKSSVSSRKSNSQHKPRVGSANKMTNTASSMFSQASDASGVRAAAEADLKMEKIDSI